MGYLSHYANDNSYFTGDIDMAQQETRPIYTTQNSDWDYVYVHGTIEVVMADQAERLEPGKADFRVVHKGGNPTDGIFRIYAYKKGLIEQA